MHRLQQGVVGAAAMLAVAPAHAGIIFTPHLSEYGKIAPGTYSEVTLIGTHIKDIYDAEGNKQALGTPFVAAGASTDAALALFKVLWVGTPFRDTNIPYLSTHTQFCRIIGGLGYQQNTDQIAGRSRLFGLKPGSNGLIDGYFLCGMHTDEHTYGPLKFNGLFATTLKEPIGEYDQNAILNVGTGYRSVIPQFAAHAELGGKLIFDGTVAYQFNGKNNKPSAGGLTPTQPADWLNIEGNLAWKFNEKWYADIGYSYHRSIGPNRYDKVTVNFKDQPVAPDTACAAGNIPREQCDSPGLDTFYLQPRPGPYFDKGVMARIVTAGVYYVYRASTVLQARVAMPIAGRGGQIDAVFDVCAVSDCPGTDNNGNGRGDNAVSTITTPLFTVQEAGATSASPYAELRMVYLFWAP